MASLQEWIHTLEEGKGARLVKLTVALLSFMALAILYDMRCFRNFSTPEAMDSAQLARNIAEGHGYSTDVIRPLSAAILRQHNEEQGSLQTPQPDLANPPVYPTLLAGYMNVTPFQFKISNKTPFRSYQPEILIAIFNQALFFFSALLLFWLTRRLFDPPVAWLTTIVYVCTDLFWRFSISGLSTMLLIVLFLGITWYLVRLHDMQLAADKPRFAIVRLSIVVGLLIGLACLTRYSFGWLLLPVLAFVAFFSPEHRFKAGFLICLAFAVVTGPWVARNFVVSGTPFGLRGYDVYQQSPAFADNALERTLDPEVTFRRFEFRDILRKTAVNVRDAVETRLPKLGGNWIGAFFLVGLLVPLQNRTASRVRVFLLAALALFVFVQALGRTKVGEDALTEIDFDNLLPVFAPLVFAYGVSLFFLLLQQFDMPYFPGWRQMVSGFLAVVVAAPLIFTLLPPKTQPNVYPPYHPPLIQQMAGWLKKSELMMTDIPWATAWYGDRQSAWLTLDTEENFYKFNDDYKTVNSLYLSPVTLDSDFLYQLYRPLLKKENTWRVFAFNAFGKGEVPTGFPLKQSRPDLLPDHLYLTDWERWGASAQKPQGGR